MDIKVLKAQGYSQRAVARTLGVHRDTVRRVWDEGEPRRYHRAPRPTKLDGFKEHLLSRLDSHPGLRATRLFREIRDRGFSGGYEMVKRWCRTWRREERVRQGTVRFETSPGLQAQADWGESRDVCFASGEVVTRYFFALVLGFSRLRFVIYLPAVTQSWLLWAHTRAFDFFGGVPERILYDNPKQIVKRPRPELRWQERLLAFASHYGYLPQACWPARPQTKGKVENAIGYHERDFLRAVALAQGRCGTQREGSLLVQGSGGAGLCQHRRFSQRTIRRGEASPAPTAGSALRLSERGDTPGPTRRADRLCRQPLLVPARFVGQQVTVKEDFDGTLHVYADADEIAVHARLSGRGRQSIVPEHHGKALARLGERKRRAPATVAPNVSLCSRLWSESSGDH